jgi:2-polyprenyl-3-methyl-5-hydroxy-6-metoxy-1,4-benzoquinol methylase
MSEILSPINGISKTFLVKKLEISKIKESYKGFNIDISRFFPKDADFIEIRECEDTGYRFYYPLNLDGDGEFYEALQKYPWYYEPWKWEYDEAIKHVKKEDKILEIGSGGNKFIEKLASLGYNITGLELNQDAVKKGLAKGLNVLPDSIQQHAEKFRGHYDVVASFQVVEHIADVQSFMQSSVDALKSGGTLIVSVPNNDSYMKLREYASLNMPPHHMGLWTKDSLTKMGEHFDLKFDGITFEPFSKFRRPYFYSVMHEGKKPYLFYKIARNFWPSLIERKFSKEFLGFTIQAKFIKI